jgi:hypothetical protein
MPDLTGKQQNNTGFDDFTTENVSIQVEEKDHSIRIIFTGMIDMFNPDQEVLPFLKGVHRKAMEETVENVEADITELSFMNSRGIKTFISWIMNLYELPADERYSLIIQYNPETTWQESSLKVMQKLFPELTVVAGS